MNKILMTLVLASLVCLPRFASSDEMKFAIVAAKDKFERTKLESLGLSIEYIRSDSVGGIVPDSLLEQIKTAGFEILEERSLQSRDFPEVDARFHNYKEMTEALTKLQAENATITSLVSIGKSLEGRDMLAIHINSNPDALKTGQSNKAGAFFTGGHHAREHLSMEIPYMYAEYLLTHQSDPQILRLIQNRDIWILPMVNPDGAEYDIATGKYQYWRKNRAQKDGKVYGVDLNRNYAKFWSGPGASSSPGSDTYYGPSAFSEPETKALKKFYDEHANIKVALDFHTFSELILYPWGGTFDPLTDARDLSVFKKMAETMAAWNKYTPEQASALYQASGVSLDWAYDSKKIFSFTFELSPSSMMGGGFYPGAKMIDPVFAANLKPLLYMSDLADNPYRAVGAGDSFLPSLHESAGETLDRLDY